jgi:hypothetical protein
MMEINPRAEISEVVILPDNAFDLLSSRGTGPADVELDREVIWQLRDYISSIAYMYRYVIGSSHEARKQSYCSDRTLSLSLCSAARTRSTTLSTRPTWRPRP